MYFPSPSTSVIDRGGGSVVAQTPFDISTDRGLSSFDHGVTNSRGIGFTIYHSATIGRFVPKGAASHILGGWQWRVTSQLDPDWYSYSREFGRRPRHSRGVSVPS